MTQISPAPMPIRSTDVPAPFQFTRRDDDGRLQRTHNLKELMGGDHLARECWLFVGPHDDDLCIGGGLMMQAAAESGVNVRSVIVTDGRQGYCCEEQKQNIAKIRWMETLASFQALRIDPNTVSNLGFPDGGLTEFTGRRLPRKKETPLCGAIGLQNSLTHELRQHRPSRVFVPTPTDLHPDHRITHSELMISVFHAAGSIWPELGPPLAEPPMVYEMAVYCDFREPPNLEVACDDEHFHRKLQSIAAFQSQAQIASLVANVMKAGPFEYFREVEFRLYSAKTYRPLFQ